MRHGPLLAGALIALASCSAATLFVYAHVVTNTTASLPPGTYWRGWPVPQRPRRGALALACPPPAAIRLATRTATILPPGPCPGGYAPLLKVVVAIAGDHVRVARTGVWINQRRLRHSRPLPDAHGVPLPRASSTIVPPGTVWLWSPVPTSLDSRYLGPLRPQALAIPLPSWTPNDARIATPRFARMPT